MRKIIVLSIVFIFFTMLSFSSIADSGPELEVGVFGASLLTGLERAGYIIYNNGDETIFNITYTFRVEGGFDNSINKIISGHQEMLNSNSAILEPLHTINGFGLVTLSIEASSSNAGSVEETMKGFQLGPYTITQTYLFAWF